MIKENYIVLKIKLKSVKSFIIAELPSEKYVEEFFSLLESEENIISFGQIIFHKSDFIYAEYYEKTKINLFKKREKKYVESQQVKYYSR